MLRHFHPYLFLMVRSLAIPCVLGAITERAKVTGSGVGHGSALSGMTLFHLCLCLAGCRLADANDNA